MAKDWLPPKDEEFNDFVTNFNTQITILGPALSLPFGVLTDFTAALPVWNTKVSGASGGPDRRTGRHLGEG